MPIHAKADFIGRDAVLEQQQKSAEWQFVAFEIMKSDADALASDPILLKGECVGYVSSGGYGFRTGKRLALGYVQGWIDLASDEFQIRILGHNYQAIVCDLPFYDSSSS